MRPRSFDEFVGQKQALGADKPLRKALEADRLTSLIIYGPPGCGKTALAHIIANQTSADFEQLNAVLAGKDDLRAVIKRARQRIKINGKQTLLFFDEIHRFNKAQQDALLPSVENGTLTLFGATTQNPHFYLNNALLSRSILVEFKPLSNRELSTLLQRALTDNKRGIRRKINLSEKAKQHLIAAANGDGRRLLTGLEIAVRSTDSEQIDLKQVEGALQKAYVEYDRGDDHHYNYASALIKSIRGSDPDAAIYYLARMLKAGEEPRFIARRLIIAAAEDIGNAAPYALTLAISAMQAVEYVGMPEAQIPLAQATTYLASSPKSNAAYKAINSACQVIENGLNLQVPEHLRNEVCSSNTEKGKSATYKYPHDYPNHYIDQDYLAEKHRFYEPTELGQEARLKKYLEQTIRRNEI
ncbi:MAG: replication-associated recombination protein A [bacterium]